MSRIHQILALLLLCIGAVSCTKYEKDIDLDRTAAKQAELNRKIESYLADAPNGWLMLIPNPDTNVITATPILFRFDTAKKVYTTKSPYPGPGNPLQYELSSATGSPLLSFASGSIISTLYELGGVSDYFFKVLDARPDTIMLQSYRKGNIYASEGGSILLLLRQKTPVKWFDADYDLFNIFTDDDSPMAQWLDNPVNLKFKNGTSTTMYLAFTQFGPDDMEFINQQIAGGRNLGGTLVGGFLARSQNNLSLYYVTRNSMFTYAERRLGTTPMVYSLPQYVIRTTKSPYLLVRSINDAHTQVDLFAVDKNGDEVVTGTFKAAR
ncbi:DUF4302 domain-containing protein [Chitinophaga sp. Cy-1792]|uniref:DUF4302 domain-containing protein n=1 Tax=Chitinophaga sp. Cy-1792 TaxID=2608339 RepID=UPI001420641B|nr:DUF4302 domain-containing protein [Chitinophaga sp. Cy-1792]